MYAEYDKFTLQMTANEAESCSHTGDCELDVLYLRGQPKIQRQFKKIAPEHIRDELQKYGAWSHEELKDDDRNQVRILWIAAGDLSEEHWLKKGRKK